MIRKLLTFIALCLCYYVNAQSSYDKGVFVMNEGWFGHCNSTINYLDENGRWIYDIIKKENPDLELGSTISYGTIYGDRFYIITKQDKDSGTDKEGARITVCDARTMKVLGQIKDIDNNGLRADGRGFLAVNNEKAYIGTNNGIYIFNLSSLKVEGKIEGTENKHTDPYGSLYMGQTGTLLRINEKVYALHQDRGLMIIDPDKDEVTDTLSGPDNGNLTYGSAVLSKDGNIWLSISDKNSRGDSYRYIMRYTPSTGDTLRVNIPKGINPPSNSWYAWTPDGFCASTKNNTLYWNTGEGGWYSNDQICKYDIDKNEFSLFVNLENENLKVYGSSMRIDPVSDNLYVTLYKDPSIPYFMMRRYDNSGKQLSEYEMSEEYWYPSIPVFPDNSLPVAHNPETTAITGNDKYIINLDAIAEDDDNMSAAMVKTILNITDKSVLSAVITDGDLVVRPLNNGNSNIELNINSNGKNTTADVAVNISECNGIENTYSDMHYAYMKDDMLHINNCKGFDFTIYDMSGKVADSFTVSEYNYTRKINVTDGIYILKGRHRDIKISFKINIR